jgi:hypothetical protein
VNKIQTEIIKEHERLESIIRAKREKLFKKWRLINLEYKMRQDN